MTKESGEVLCGKAFASHGQEPGFIHPRGKKGGAGRSMTKEWGFIHIFMVGLASFSLSPLFVIQSSEAVYDFRKHGSIRPPLDVVRYLFLPSSSASMERPPDGVVSWMVPQWGDHLGWLHSHG